MQKPKMTPEDKLKLHQLRILEWYTEQGQQGEASNFNQNENQTATLPLKWSLTKNINLYKWQKECVKAWFANNYSGTVKVVTGAGKTILALSIIEQLQNTIDKDLYVVIVVPTIVLMNQWYDEIIKNGNIPQSFIGRMGGGYQDDFSNGKRILISVLVSASQKLEKVINSKISEHLLLVVDECHRAGSNERKRVFNIKRKYSLGLSATPERDENLTNNDDNTEYNESETGKSLGKIICELTYKKALELGVIPLFSIYHYGLDLNKKESAEYQSLSRSLNTLQQELKQLSPNGVKTESDFWRWIRVMANKDSEISNDARRLQGYIKSRKALLYGIENRKKAVKYILEKEFSNNNNLKAILFHESIEEAKALYFYLIENGFPAILEHSKLPSSIRTKGLDLFRNGDAKILVSVKTLIEGFNVPATDIGIIVASSSSPRQRIQSMGRVLRKQKDNKDQTSKIYILYAKNTVDEVIYEKLDWDSILGAKHNHYYHWFEDKGAILQQEAPRISKKKDYQIDLTELNIKSGDEYPGEYEGDEFSCDNQKNITDSNGNLIVDKIGLANLIIKTKGAGKFKVTPKKHYVLVKVKTPDDKWVVKYITTLEKPLTIKGNNQEKIVDIDTWVQNAKPGDVYPFNSEIKLKLKFSLKKGGIIAKKIQKGETFAKTIENAKDKSKGESAEMLLNAIRTLNKKGKKISKFEINQNMHAIFKENGEYYFIYALKDELEFSK